MDPFIDPEALDPAHPLTPRKLENLARADAAHRARSSEVGAMPSKVTFQTTDVCNLACPHCQIPKALKRASMGTHQLDLLRDQLLPDLVELHPTNLGEPFAWPHFERLCADLDQNGVVLDLTTNGTMLTPGRIEWIAPIARDVKVSFDGATPQTFEKFRRGADFESVCEGVRALALRFSRVRTRRPILALQMTLMRDNVDELPALIRLAHRLGAQRVKAYHLFSFGPELDEQSLAADPSHYQDDILPAALAIGDELGIDLQLAEPSGGSPDALVTRVCHLPWHETWVDVDGAVLICHSHGNEIAGHLADFQSAWNGPTYQEVRRGFASGQPVGSCDGCGMNYEKPSEHVPVPFDAPTFTRGDANEGTVRWSGRMRQFDLRGRRDGF